MKTTSRLFFLFVLVCGLLSGCTVAPPTKDKCECKCPEKPAQVNPPDAKIEDHFTYLDDKDVPIHLREIAANWRKLATEQGYNGPVAWRSREGFSLKQHVPKVGKVHYSFVALKGWMLQNDEPTKSGTVFWIPKPLKATKAQTVDQQRVIMAETRKRYGLPQHHLSTFGSAGLLSGLVLANLKRTTGDFIHKSYSVRTDTLHDEGCRIYLELDGGAEALDYGCWKDVGDGNSNFQVFSLGVELD